MLSTTRIALTRLWSATMAALTTSAARREPGTELDPTSGSTARTGRPNSVESTHLLPKQNETDHGQLGYLLMFRGVLTCFRGKRVKLEHMGLRVLVME